MGYYNYQQEPATGYRNERGGCLSFYLIVSAIFAVLGIFALCTLLSDLNEVQPGIYRQRDTSQLHAGNVFFLFMACNAYSIFKNHSNKLD